MRDRLVRSIPTLQAPLLNSAGSRVKERLCAVVEITGGVGGRRENLRSRKRGVAVLLNNIAMFTIARRLLETISPLYTRVLGIAKVSRTYHYLNNIKFFFWANIANLYVARVTPQTTCFQFRWTNVLRQRSH